MRLGIIVEHFQAEAPNNLSLDTGRQCGIFQMAIQTESTNQCRAIIFLSWAFLTASSNGSYVRRYDFFSKTAVAFVLKAPLIAIVESVFVRTKRALNKDCGQFCDGLYYNAWPSAVLLMCRNINISKQKSPRISPLSFSGFYIRQTLIICWNEEIRSFEIRFRCKTELICIGLILLQGKVCSSRDLVHFFYQNTL